MIDQCSQAFAVPVAGSPQAENSRMEDRWDSPELKKEESSEVDNFLTTPYCVVNIIENQKCSYA